MLIRLFLKPGMMWPVRARVVGMVKIFNWAVPTEVHRSPVAVRMVVVGAMVLLLLTGAVSVK